MPEKSSIGTAKTLRLPQITVATFWQFPSASVNSRHRRSTGKNSYAVVRSVFSGMRNEVRRHAPGCGPSTAGSRRIATLGISRTAQGRQACGPKGRAASERQPDPVDCAGRWHCAARTAGSVAMRRGSGEEFRLVLLLLRELN